jgi:hypothetical protein
MPAYMQRKGVVAYPHDAPADMVCAQVYCICIHIHIRAGVFQGGVWLLRRQIYPVYYDGECHS